MTGQSDPRLIKRLSIFAAGSSLFAIAVGTSGLGGWAFHIGALITWGAAPVTMVANTATCFVLVGVSLWLLRKPGNLSFALARNLTAKTTAAVAGLVGALSLAEHIFRLDLGIDQLLLVVPPETKTAASRGGLMSPITAAAFLLLGLALLGIDWRTRKGAWPAQFLSLSAGAAAAFGIFSFAFDPRIYTSHLSLSLPTAVTMLFFSMGLVCSRTAWGLGALLCSRSLGGSLARRLLPAALIPVLVGWIRWQVTATGAYSEWTIVVLAALTTMSLLAGIIAWAAMAVDRNDAERRRVEAALHVSEEQLNRLLDRIEEPKAESELRRRVTMGFSVAVLLTGLLAFLSWRNALEAAADADWVAHTREVIATLEGAIKHLVDMETGARGFAMTGRDSFLEPYVSGQYGVSHDLSLLHGLVGDNPDQQRRLAELEENANANIGASKEIVAARKRTGAIPDVAQLERGKEIMDTARLTVERMDAEERRLLEARTQRTRSARHFAVSLIALGSIAGVVFLIMAGFSVSRQIGVSARARAQIKALNTDLERRVEQRTAALGASEGRLAGVIHSAMDAILTVDDQQSILLFNAAAERMFRCPAAEALGKPITRFIPQRFHAVHSEHIRKFGDTGVTNRTMGPKNVLWAVRAGGEEFQIEASISQVVADGKKLFTVILRDVTERIQAEEAREHLAAVVDSSDDAIISKDLNGTINGWNRGAEKVFGYTASEAIGQPMLMLIPPDHVHEESDILARIKRGESVEHFETTRLRKNGARIQVSATISPIRDRNGAIVGASKIARDITEHKQAEEALRDQAQIMDSAQVFVRDMQSRVVFWPKGAEKLYGYTRQEAVGILSHDLFHTRFPEPLEMIEKRLFETGMWEGELIHTRRDGSVIVVSSAWVLHRDSQGKAIRILETNTDITDRKKAEAALRESEERFQAMANGIPQLAWMAEADGSIFWYNQRWYDYTGTTLEQMQGWRWQSVHDPDILPKVLERWKNAIAGGNPFEMEFPLRGAEGSFRTFLTRIVPVKDSEGRVVRWFGTNTDISERKDAEDRLASLAEKLARQAVELTTSREAMEVKTRMLQLVLDSMGEGLIAADRDGHFLLWNNSAFKMMGRDATDLPSEQWTPHYKVYLPDGITPYPPERLPLVRALRGESVLEELMIEHPEREGGVFLEVTARPMKDASGNLCGGVAALRDITERKRAEAVLARQTEELSRQTEELLRSQHALETQTLMLRSVLDSMEEGLVATDEQGKFIIWNPAAERIVGMSAANLTSEEWSSHYGLYLADTVTPFPTEQNPLLLAIRGEAGSAEMFIRNLELDQGVWVEANASPLKDKNGSLRGGVVAFRDITQRKASEREIRKLYDELEERVVQRTAQLEAANKELETFSYSVSHDLRAPLRHISGFTKILVEDFGPTLPPDARRHLDRIEQGAHRMGQLVDELLNLTRVGRQALTVQATGLSTVVKDIVALLEPEVEGRKIEWNISALPFVECDPILIRQVFQNLISNALKYSRPRSPAVIEIGHTEKDGQQVIFVRDNGVGFSMKYADKLFGVFQRLHRAEDFEGTGVGLATVHRIVQKHGGRVWAEAELDQGATFYFTLGRSEPSAPKNSAASAGGQS